MQNESIGMRIAALRKGKGLTQNELAIKLEVSDKTISKWETDGGLPDVMNLVPLAKELGVSIEYILTGISVNNDKPKKIDDFIDDGIVDIKKLINYGDLNLLKKGLKDYPIHNIEKVISMLENEDYRALYRYSIDYNIHDIKNCFLEGNLSQLEGYIVKNLWNNNMYNERGRENGECLNSAFLFKNINEHSAYLKNISEVKKFICDKKQEILDLFISITNELKEKGKDYFMTDLDRGYPEETVKELYSILDKYLELNYYNYDFISHRLDAYAKEHGISGSFYRGYENSKDLNKLIKFINKVEVSYRVGSNYTPGELREIISAVFRIIEEV